MKGPIKNKQGSSLLEVVIAIALLAIMVAPVCSSLVLSFRLNADSEEILQARLAVESTVEQLMAEGLIVHKNDGEEQLVVGNTVADGIVVKTDATDTDALWYAITVESTVAPEVTVDTIVKAATVIEDVPGDFGEDTVEPTPGTPEEGGGN